MKDKLYSLLCIPFLLCLATLLLNDFYLKSEYHNWITGKLSDFSGLFVFVWFWMTIFPNKNYFICLSSGMLFIFWKSVYSQSFIDWFSQAFYVIERIVDITDLIALPVIPIAFYLKRRTLSTVKISPFPVAFLTVFSFCATSVPEPSIRFEQPQYLLFKSGADEFKVSQYPSEFEVYSTDTIFIISIREIRLEKRSPIDDEFYKVQILKDLDLRVLRESKEGYKLNGKLNDYKELRDSLIHKGIRFVRLRLDTITEELNFKDSRLHGSFKRFSINNQLLINGKYINGIEDSVWNFYGNQGEVVARKYFEDGELVKLEIYENSRLKTEETLNTRKNTIKNKYFLIAFILILIIGLIFGIIYNYKKSQYKDRIIISDIGAVAGSLILPFFAIILSEVISSFIPNSYSSSLFEIIPWIILTYVITAFGFVIIFSFLKPRSSLDLVFYFLIISFAIVLVNEWTFLRSLI